MLVVWVGGMEGVSEGVCAFVSVFVFGGCELCVGWRKWVSV